MVGKGPVKKIRAGSVSCALWENEINVNGTKKTVLKATLDRRYKDQNGEWKSSSSFGRNEIALAIYCLAHAFHVMVGEQGGNGEVEEEVIM